MAENSAAGYSPQNSMSKTTPEQSNDREITVQQPGIVVFLFVVTVYALCGEAAPASFGMAELLVGAGLLYITGYYSIATLFKADQQLEPWRAAGLVFMVYGVFCGLVNAALYGNDISLVIRDIAPFLFMFLPVFLYGWLRRLDIGQKKAVTAGIVFIGLCFAVRVLALVTLGEGDTLGSGNTLWDVFFAPSPALLANAPTVLFSAVLLIGMGGFYLIYMRNMVDFGRAVLFIGLAFLPVAAMAVIEQRASMAYVVAAVIMLICYSAWRFPYRMVVPVAFAALIIGAVFPFGAELWQTLEHKHTVVGLNMREREAAAVLDMLGGSVWTVLFGQGWGATVQSAATGGVTVNFTHSLVSAVWLKTGLTGVVLAALYLGALALRLYAIGGRYVVIMIAAAGPFVIDVFLYASYKSLDFGLLLLLIPLWADILPRVEKTRRV